MTVNGAAAELAAGAPSQELEHAQQVDPPATVLELLCSIDGRLARLEAKFAEYEPLIDMVKERADRGSWRTKFGGKPVGT